MGSTPQISPDRSAEYERRAPGWNSRCLTCGLVEPYGKHGIRIAAAGSPRKLYWCDRCQRFRCHRVERREEAKTAPKA